MKRYILGYYCRDDVDLQIFNRDSNRDILNALVEAYPSGLTAHEIAEKTGNPIKTVYSQLPELYRESFIEDMDNKEQPVPRGRPPLKATQASVSRTRNKVVIENANSLFDRYIGKQAGRVAPPPGNIVYSDEFIYAWNKIVGKEEQDEFCVLFVELLEKILRRVSESDDDKVSEIAPTTDMDFCCSQCGLNHEARDFMRAALLYLLDQSEISNNYVEFLKRNNLVTSAAYEIVKSKIAKRERLEDTSKVALSDIKSKNEEETITLRIISIGADNSRGYLSCLAINQNKGLIPLSIHHSLAKNCAILPDSMIECIPSAMLDHYIFLSENDSYLKVIKDDKSFPKLSNLRKIKIKDIPMPPEREEEIQGIVDATVEQIPTVDKFGQLKSTLLIADDSGKAGLIYDAFWRSQMNYLKRYGDLWRPAYPHMRSAPLKVGDQIRIIGATAGLGEENNLCLILREYSSIANIQQDHSRIQYILRILSIEKDTGKNEILFLAINKDRQFVNGTIDYALVTDEMTTDAVLKCTISEENLLDTTEGILLFLSEDVSYVQVINDDPSIPKLSELRTKIKDIRETKEESSEYYILEATVLQQPTLTELTRNDGKPYSVTSTVIGDGSGTIRLDDNFHTNLSKLNKGDRIKIIGVIALPRNENDGKITLITVPYGSIIKI